MADRNSQAGTPGVYGIGNPLIDLSVRVEDSELSDFGLAKGTMHLIEPDRREELLARLEDKERRHSCGGSCPNTMIALATFGVDAALAGKIGNDDLGGIYRDCLVSHGVTSTLKSHDGPTGTSIVMVTPDSERTMNTHLGACREFGVADVDFSLIEGARYLYFTGYMWDTDVQKEAVLAAIAHAKTHGTSVVFDVADPFAADRNREEFLALIRSHADVVFANASEAELLLGIDDARRAAQQMAAYVQRAAIKAGSGGSFVVEAGGNPCHIPAVPVPRVVDTTGAGDVYAAGFLCGLIRGLSAAGAGEIASLAASRIIQQTGAQFDANAGAELRKAIHTIRPMRSANGAVGEGDTNGTSKAEKGTAAL